MLAWFGQQPFLFQIGVVIALLMMGCGLWKTLFSGERKSEELPQPKQEKETRVIEEDIHEVATERLVDDFVYTPERERVSELAADVFSEEYDLGDEFEGEDSLPYLEDPLPPSQPSHLVHSRQRSPRTVQPRYPTQPSPARQRPTRPAQPPPVRQRPTHPVQPQPYPPRRRVKPLPKMRGGGW